MRSRHEVESHIRACREWFYAEFGDELPMIEVLKYFSDKRELEKESALRARFESYRGKDISTAISVAVEMNKSIGVSRLPKQEASCRKSGR